VSPVGHHQRSRKTPASYIVIKQGSAAQQTFAQHVMNRVVLIDRIEDGSVQERETSHLHAVAEFGRQHPARATDIFRTEGWWNGAIVVRASAPPGLSVPIDSRFQPPRADLPDVTPWATELCTRASPSSPS
jgi:hypothetical protein